MNWMKLFGVAAGLAPVVGDLISNGQPGWLSALGGTILGGVGVVHRVQKKRATGAKPFDTAKARDKIERMR